MIREQSGTEMPDDIDSSIGKPTFAGALFLGLAVAAVLWALGYATVCWALGVIGW